MITLLVKKEASRIWLVILAKHAAEICNEVNFGGTCGCSSEKR